MEIVFTNRLQYLIFIALSLGVLGFTGILNFSNHLLFQRFLGRINPLVAFLIIIILGFILLTFLISQNWFTIYEKENAKGLFAAGLASIFGVIIILVDTKIIFPEDTNILFPESLLFYPAIGFLVEILFHVLPVTILLVILNSIFVNANFEQLVWISILIISILEPIYHMSNMAFANHFPLWGIIYVGFHVFLINFCQLLLFRNLHVLLSACLLPLLAYWMGLSAITITFLRDRS